jgi:hypothetical protein
MSASTKAANDTGEDLWTVPPEQFVATRNALAKKTGDASIKELKRPSPSAWLVNMLVHTAPREVEKIFHAGDKLHTAQGRVLAGADPSELQDAMRAVREAVNAAMKQAKKILAENKRKPTADLVRRVTHTLRSAAIDKRLRQVVEEGHLSADPITDDIEALSDVKVPKRIPATTREPSGRQRELADRKQKKEEARAAREAAKAERARAAREAKEQLKREAAAAEAEERRARAELDEAMKSLARARAAHKQARDAHVRAKKRSR